MFGVVIKDLNFVLEGTFEFFFFHEYFLGVLENREYSVENELGFT
jgi:hypothetical protein